MADTVADLTTPRNVRISSAQAADANGEPLPHVQLWTIRQIEEDESGAILHFQQGGQGHLANCDPAFATHLQLARRCHSRQHPVGIRFGEGRDIAELIRADNDVPSQWLDDGAYAARVHFEGHDGVFFIQADHPEFARIRKVLVDAIGNKSRVWFVARKPQMILSDAAPVEAN